MRFGFMPRVVVVLGVLAFANAQAHGQCDLAWQPGLGRNGADEPVLAVHRWDPDGPGPAPLRLAFGGDFRAIGSIPAARVAMWNPVTGEWSALGQGVSGVVSAFATAANGDLLVGGTLTLPLGPSSFSMGIARWNGSAWSPLGQGVNGRVRDIAVMPNGDIVVVGSFVTSGSTVVNHIARWNGSTWQPLGTGSSSGLVAVQALPNGDLVVGGEFTSIGGVAANRIARWDGALWHPMGAGVTGTIFSSSTIAIYDLDLLPNGRLVASGNFTTAGGVASQGIAEWDGTSWSSLGVGLAWSVWSMHVTNNGTLLVCAPAYPGGPGISEWNGVTWQPVTQGLPNPGRVVQLPNGDLVAVGEFSLPASGGRPIENVARWDGTAWLPLASPASPPWFQSALDPGIRAIAATPGGTLYATGLFQVVDGVPLNGIARFNGTTWDPVGGPLGIGSAPFPYPWPLTMIAMRNGDVVVGGRMTSIAGAPAGHVARWNGTAWNNFGGGVGAAGTVAAIAELPDGDIVVGGDLAFGAGAATNYIARWDGTSWQALGAGLGAHVSMLEVMPNGDLVAGGTFATVGGLPANGVARWDGSTWSPLGTGPARLPHKLRALPNGDLAAILVPPAATNLWSVHRWNEATWTQLGQPIQAGLTDLVALPDGDLLVAGNSASASAWRWDGLAWNPTSATDVGFVSHAWLPDGDLVVAGSFAAAGPWLSPRIARLRSTCAAAASVTGVGCAGSGGNNLLRAATLPWLGSTFRARGTGLPSSAFVSQVWGFAGMQLPLAVLLPQAPPGCDLLVTPDHVEFGITTDGTFTTSLVLPNLPTLVGLQLRHQLNLFEVDASLGFLAVTASNALLLTTGVF